MGSIFAGSHYFRARTRRLGSEMNWSQGTWRSVAQDGQGMGLEVHGPGGACDNRIARAG